VYRNAGMTRISIGLQSCDPGLLETLGRSHDLEAFLKAYSAARNAGFKDINIDLMFGIPGQTLEVWADTLEKVCNLHPEHISAYSLTLDSDTPIAKRIKAGELTAAEDEEDRELYHYAAKYLKSNGYVRYEISNFAKNGHYSRHNLNYWKNGEYLAFGAGAHSYVNRIRWSNIADPNEYIRAVMSEKPVKTDITRVSDRNFMAEYIFLRLRLIEGIDLFEFEKIFKSSIYKYHNRVIRDFIEEGLLIESAGHLKLTEKGLDLANIVMSEFI
jgi:oxygen-independent coproporphyrinogen-3 oxidase